MDNSRFDQLAQSISDLRPGRRALLGLPAALAGAWLGLPAANAAAAACVPLGKKQCRGKRNRKCCPGTRCQGGNKRPNGTCVCGTGTTECSGACIDRQSDPTNCGSCGNVCSVGLPCTNGVCRGDGPQGCPAVDYCAASLRCPDKPNCFCTKDANGDAQCAQLFSANAYCANCASNADCNNGYLCIKPTEGCVQCGSENGTACIAPCA